MLASLRALLTGAIDYAGLFPPAKLPLEPALRNYARYRTEPEAWMLGRFVIPAARLVEIDAIADVLAHGLPFVFSVLGRGGDSAEAWQSGLDADLECIRAFRGRHGDRVVVDAFEVKAPANALAGHDAFAAASKKLGLAGLSVVYEIPLGPEWERTTHALVALLAGKGAGIKLRTGGLEAAAFPSAVQVARVIEECRAHRLPLKCTAGLHHPLYHYDPGVKANMHGFLNVILACVLAYARGLVEREIEPLLSEPTLEHIEFSNDGVTIFGHRVDLEQLAFARQEAFLSFGSCSFDEPRDDLRGLGLL